MILDIIVIALLLVFFVFGWRRGFVKIAFGVFSFVIAILLAWSISPTITGFLSETPIEAQIEQQVYEHMIKKELRAVQSQESVTEAPEMYENAENIKHYAEAEIRMAAAKKTTDLILSILSIVVVVVITKLLMMLLQFLLSTAASLPIIRGLDHLLGGSVFLFLVCFIIEVLCLLLKWTETSEFSKGIISMIHSSYVANNFYENNQLLNSLF